MEITAELIQNMVGEENKMELVKIVTNGPATIGWFISPLWSGEKKFVVKKAPFDNYDAEKAVLMLYMKAMCGDDTKFHQWMKKQMDVMNEAIAKEIKPKLEAAGIVSISEEDQEMKDRIKEAADNWTPIAKAEEEPVSPKSNKRKVRKWTTNEIAFLKSHNEDMKRAEIATFLGRSEASINVMCQRLGLKKG